jgi:hypothetical protein
MTNILNGIQILYQVKNDYLAAATQWAKNYLNLLLNHGDNHMVEFKQIQTLFKK